MSSFIKPGSLFFAPMEGVTDESYRLAVGDCYSEWDYYATDFLRIPTNGHYPPKIYLEHFGEQILERDLLAQKTIFQVLTSDVSQIEVTIEKIAELGFKWLDLNLGCPSRTVNTHRGGAYLLKDQLALENVITRVRKHFPHRFTCKMRLGFHDTDNFIDTLKFLESSGVEAITIHARTRDQIYQGSARWEFIKEAVKAVDIPIIGNGDLWTVADIQRMFEETQCHAVMVARGALKTPWLARLYQSRKTLTQEELNVIRSQELPRYFQTFVEHMRNKLQNESPNHAEVVIIKRLKTICRYLFEDFVQGDEIKSRFLRSQKLEEMMEMVLEIHG